jgi:hypothetical protein
MPEPHDLMDPHAHASLKQAGWPTPIPVTERPAEDTEVLVYDKHHGEWFPATFKCEMYETTPKFWVYSISDEDSSSYCETTLDSLTHWLPRPPDPT